MMIKAESYKIFSEIYCPIVPAPLELFSGDGCRSVSLFYFEFLEVPTQFIFVSHLKIMMIIM